MSQCSLYWRLVWSQGWCGRLRIISPPPEFDPRIVQPVASLYTECAILAPCFLLSERIVSPHENPLSIPIEKCIFLSWFNVTLVPTELTHSNHTYLHPYCAVLSVEQTNRSFWISTFQTWRQSSLASVVPNKPTETDDLCNNLYHAEL